MLPVSLGWPGSPLLVDVPAVNEILWFAAGAAAVCALVPLWRQRSRPPRPAPPPEVPRAPVAAPAAAPVNTEAGRWGTETPPECRWFASALAEELATLVSGVEGRAHSLVASAPERAALPQAAEALLGAVQRLRTLHRRLAAFGGEERGAPGAAELGGLVPGLSDDLQHLQLGLELRWTPAPALPRIAAQPEALRDALLCCASALLRTERGATRLTIDAERGLGDEPTVHLELLLEWGVEHGAGAHEVGQDAACRFEREAATVLLRGLGGEVAFDHLPGRSARALVTLPAVPALGEPATASHDEPAVVTTRPRHRYGGALVLEADPSIRAMLAQELKAAGRAVFACADGASAQSFLAATPERFELLIVDHPRHLDEGDALGAAVRALAPGLKVCVLGGSGQSVPGHWPRLHRIDKPFGVHELRQALASVLAAG